ncbi:Rossmann-like domain-containing protein [Azospirillum argentinense]
MSAGSEICGGKADAVPDVAKAPWIRPGLVLHEPGAAVDGLFASFALELKARGFTVGGFVQLNNSGREDLGRGCEPRIELLDLDSGETLWVERDEGAIGHFDLGALGGRLETTLRSQADLVLMSRFAAFEQATPTMRALVGQGLSAGLPVLTSIAGRCLGKWRRIAGAEGELLNADPRSLWNWWGPERLYQDLMLGTMEDEVRRIVCGPRWIMVVGPHGAGLSYLPRHPQALLPRLPAFRRQSLRDLARLALSWDPLEAALGIAAINAHTNRFDLAAERGNGTSYFARERGRVVVIGGFPGRRDILPDALVVETDPQPGDYPTAAMDTLLPGSAAVVASSSSLVNRTLARVLRFAKRARVALVGPATPLTPRLHAYGCEILGGFLVQDVDGLAQQLEAGALPRDFGRFGRYVHIRQADRPAAAAPVKPGRRHGAGSATFNNAYE